MHKLNVLVLVSSLAALLCGVAGAAYGDSVPNPDPAWTVAVFISQRMFMEEAFQMVTRRLDKAGYKVVITAKDTSLAIGMDKSVVRPDRSLETCRPESIAALVVINGSGIATYWQDSLLLARCREFAEAGRVLGSIGIANICLANAGVLKGHKATISSERYTVRQLLAGGARYWPNPVVTDRNVITASDTEYARRFVDVLIKMLDRHNTQR